MPTDYISMATDPDLTTASRGLTRHAASQLVSIAGNVAITQLVDKPNSAST
jgi:acetamidase/formamidase